MAEFYPKNYAFTLIEMFDAMHLDNVKFPDG